MGAWTLAATREEDKCQSASERELGASLLLFVLHMKPHRIAVKIMIFPPADSISDYNVKLIVGFY